MPRSSNPVHSARKRSYSPKLKALVNPPKSDPLAFLLTAKTQVLDRGFDELYDAAVPDLDDFSELARQLRDEEFI